MPLKVTRKHEGDHMGGFKLMKGVPEGTCAECAVKHDPSQPHNQQSLHYKYHFYERFGAWPTWADAMAHCADEVRDKWLAALREQKPDLIIGEVLPAYADHLANQDNG